MSTERLALVTGGARGIGYACAEALKEDGYGVILCDIDADGVAAAAGRLGAVAGIALRHGRCGRGAGDVRPDRGGARAGLRAGEQRRRRHAGRFPRLRPRGLRRGHRDQPARHVRGHPAGGEDDGGERHQGRDRQHVLDQRATGDPGDPGLLRVEGWGDAADQGRGAGAGAQGHPGERGWPGVHRHRHDGRRERQRRGAGACPVPHAARPDREPRARSATWWRSCARTRQATSPARRSTSMAGGWGSTTRCEREAPFRGRKAPNRHWPPAGVFRQDEGGPDAGRPGQPTFRQERGVAARCGGVDARGPPAFGPVPDSPSPPKGWLPTMAPIWLRLT
jgi:hypothetical protein